LIPIEILKSIKFKPIILQCKYVLHINLNVHLCGSVLNTYRHRQTNVYFCTYLLNINYRRCGEYSGKIGFHRFL
jgi:hypothetical protein